jgi:hypothetical protein
MKRAECEEQNCQASVKSVKLFKWPMTLAEAGLIKFLDAQLQDAAEGPFSPNEQDVDLVSLYCNKLPLSVHPNLSI